MQVDAATNKATRWAFVGGRPLSGTFDRNGDLVLTCAIKGLCKVDKNTRKVMILCNKSDNDNREVHFADDVDIDQETGKIYFTDATVIAPWREGYNREHVVVTKASTLELFEGRQTGRVIEYDPNTDKSRVLMDGIWFANGIALSPNKDFLLASSTFGREILRYWLKGEKAGQKEEFITCLPGFPDGVSIDEYGRVWIALVGLDMTGFEHKMFASTTIRKIVSKMNNQLKRYGLICCADLNGKILKSYHDPTGQVVHTISAVTYYKGKLYIGSFTKQITVYDLKDDEIEQSLTNSNQENPQTGNQDQKAKENDEHVQNE